MFIKITTPSTTSLVDETYYKEHWWHHVDVRQQNYEELVPVPLCSAKFA
jgi:hypothetical protein